MESWPIIVPAFINGLTNDFIGDIRGNFDGSRKVIAGSHKRIADDLLKKIYALGDEERSERARIS